MGWTQIYDITLKGIIARLTEDNEWERNGRNVKEVTLARCFRGAVTHKGNLWCVHQRHIKFEDGTDETHRYIALYLLTAWKQGEDRGWGYKDLDESMGPCEVNCPKSYLTLVDINVYGGNKEWREGVMRYHARRAEIRKAKKQAKLEQKAREKEWAERWKKAAASP